MGFLGAAESPLIAGGFTIAGSMLAVLATLRYIKRTEDDSVNGLRARVRDLEAEVKNCREEAREFRAQIERLISYLRLQGHGVPDGFWD